MTPDTPGEQSSGWLRTPQPRLHAPGLVGLLVLANALIPFSLDIYTPAVPEMPEHFHTTASMVNLTILGFFLFFAVGLLVFGPLSDKFGRKPVLVAGMATYVVASALCAVSTSIWMLIGARVIQALGAGAVNAVSTALVKDCFHVTKRGTMLALIQIMAVIGPILAPLLGGVIIHVSSWRMVFWTLAALGLICFAATLMFSESLPERDRVHTGVFSSLKGLGSVLRHRRFMYVLLAAGMYNVPFMAYIAVGSYIYVDYFGTSQQTYTYFFAATAAFSALGPMLHVRYGKSVSPYRLTYAILTASAIVGAALLFVGDKQVWIFALLMALFACAEATVRPYTTDMLLGLRTRDTGSASAMINFLHTMLGVVGMAVIMAPFPDYVVGVGAIMVASMLIALALWAMACRSPEQAPDGR